MHSPGGEGGGQFHSLTVPEPDLWGWIGWIHVQTRYRLWDSPGARRLLGSSVHREEEIICKEIEKIVGAGRF